MALATATTTEVGVQVGRAKAGRANGDGGGGGGVGPAQFVTDPGRRQARQVRMIPGVVLDLVTVGTHPGKEVAMARDGPADDEERGGNVVALEDVEHGRRGRTGPVVQRQRRLAGAGPWPDPAGRDGTGLMPWRQCGRRLRVD
jgi:hypothetical protein